MNRHLNLLPRPILLQKLNQLICSLKDLTADIFARPLNTQPSIHFCRFFQGSGFLSGHLSSPPHITPSGGIDFQPHICYNRHEGR